MRTPLALAALLATAAGATAAAQAPPPLTLDATTAQAGQVRLALTGPPGATVELTEATGDGGRPLGELELDAEGHAALPRAARWRCEPRQRRFSARGTAPDGTAVDATATVTTPSCANRLAVRIEPKRPRAGRPVRVEVRDRFHLRSRGRACARGPAGLERCAPLAVRTRGTVRLELPRAGRWRVRVRLGGAGRAGRTLTVRPPPGPLRLLATGDSMIQIIDDFLKARLAPGGVEVRSDARISTGLSKPEMFNWPAHARRQVAGYRPGATVMFIGANDGYPFGSAGCCGRIWQRRYARVAGAMMDTYARAGAGTVFWCLLPAPRPANFRRVFAAVNRAVRAAAGRHPGTVHLVDLPRVFTPGYRFRQTITWDGRVRNVRQPDGIHLNATGASIAATVLVRALRRAGQL